MLLTCALCGTATSVAIADCVNNTPSPFTHTRNPKSLSRESKKRSKRRREETLRQKPKSLNRSAMEKSGIEASSMATSQQRITPVCGCGDIMQLYISNSSENPRRRYWKCNHWNSRQSCKLYLWDDELTENEVGVIVGDGVAGGVAARACKACQFAETLLESRNLKIEKYKLKLGNEMAIIRWLVFALFSSWALFLGFFICKM